MITPVTPHGELDEPAVRRVIDHLIEGGVSGIFILGTTGESASIPAAMKSRLVALTVEHTAKRVMVYAGISHNCLTYSVEAAQTFFELGVDVTVAHLPSYYELNPAEQEAYFITLSKNLTGPLMLYNIPITTHMSMPLGVIERLSKLTNIVGMKDSENDAARLANEINLFGQPAGLFHFNRGKLSASSDPATGGGWNRTQLGQPGAQAVPTVIRLHPAR